MKPLSLRIGIVLASAALLVGTAAASPLVLRSWDAFDVRHVKVVGARHLSAEAAVAASGIVQTASVFADATPWREKLLAHPLVAEVRIERRVPNTLVLHIRESVPVAFARTPEIRAIDARGRILPIDYAAAALDLPVLTLNTRVAANSTATDAETLRVVALIAEVGRHEPGLLGWISEVGVHGAAVRLVLRNATDADVLMPAQPTPERLRELHLTLADLATPALAISGDSTAARAAATELSRVRRIDVRFDDQIVVALHGGKS